LTLPAEPADVQEMVSQIRRLSRGLVRPYLLAYEVGYSSMGAAALGDKVSSGLVDPTESAVLSRARTRTRRAVEEASKDITSALNFLETARSKLHGAIPDPLQTETPFMEFPRVVKESELKEYEEARKRRRERGEE